MIGSNCTLDRWLWRGFRNISETLPGNFREARDRTLGWFDEDERQGTGLFLRDPVRGAFFRRLNSHGARGQAAGGDEKFAPRYGIVVRWNWSSTDGSVVGAARSQRAIAPIG
jgi:hypothetical protein